MSTFAERAANRRRNLECHAAADFEDAERWDLEFWARQSPQDRLSAFVELREQWESIKECRKTMRPRKE
jgi:hypothetical protein